MVLASPNYFLWLRSLTPFVPHHLKPLSDTPTSADFQYRCTRRSGRASLILYSFPHTLSHQRIACSLLNTCFSLNSPPPAVAHDPFCVSLRHTSSFVAFNTCTQQPLLCSIHPPNLCSIQHMYTTARNNK